MIFEVLLLTALLADALIGDPRWLPHPVCGIGRIALFSEKHFRRLIPHQRLAGIFTFLSTLFLSVGSIVWLLKISFWYSHVLQSIIAVTILYFFIAVKDLITHSREVYISLSEELPISGARKAIGRIVGRDTKEMSRADICRACVETVAENMVDGITAPVFWAIIFSLFAPVLSFQPIALAAIGITAYKTINTMDSMFGYKNDRYLYFGWASARIDDIVNFLPARMSGAFVILAAYILRLNGRSSLQIFCRDRLNHTSPNAAHTEAAVAGAIGVQLGGASSYFAEIVKKPLIGEQVQAISPSHILKTNALVVVSSFLFIVFFCLLRRVALVFF